jgi:hypothetical protein
MNLKSAGFILLTTVMMIVVLTVLVMAPLKSVMLYMKAYKAVIESDQMAYNLEQVAYRLAASPFAADCIVNDVDPNQIRYLLQQIKCSLKHNDIVYDYIINDLGIYPCLKIDAQGILYSSHHWLIHVVASGSKEQRLNLRIAKPDKALPCELMNQRQIHSGLVSWI